MSQNTTTNKNATIRTRHDRNGNLRTETARRDPGQFDVAISTDERNNSTTVFIDAAGRDANSFAFGADLKLNGREARTLYKALARHFAAQDKTQHIYR